LARQPLPAGAGGAPALHGGHGLRRPALCSASRLRSGDVPRLAAAARAADRGGGPAAAGAQPGAARPADHPRDDRRVRAAALGFGATGRAGRLAGAADARGAFRPVLDPAAGVIGARRIVVIGGPLPAPAEAGTRLPQSWGRGAALSPNPFPNPGGGEETVLCPTLGNSLRSPGNGAAAA